MAPKIPIAILVVVNGGMTYEVRGVFGVNTVSLNGSLGVDASSSFFNGFDGYTFDGAIIATAVIPLPASAWMGLTLLGGLGAVGVVRRAIRAA